MNQRRLDQLLDLSIILLCWAATLLLLVFAVAGVVAMVKS